MENGQKWRWTGVCGWGEQTRRVSLCCGLQQPSQQVFCKPRLYLEVEHLPPHQKNPLTVLWPPVCVSFSWFSSAACWSPILAGPIHLLLSSQISTDILSLPNGSVCSQLLWGPSSVATYTRPQANSSEPFGKKSNKGSSTCFHIANSHISTSGSQGLFHNSFGCRAWTPCLSRRGRQCMSLGLITTMKAKGTSYLSPHLWHLGQIPALASQMLLPEP